MKRKIALKAYTTLIIFSLLFPSTVSAQLWSIAFTGREADQQGIAAWNADGTGIDPPAWGHAIPDPYDFCFFDPYAFYYIGSRTAGAFHGTGAIVGFPQFKAALTANGYSISELTMHINRMTLRDDFEWIDWSIEDGVEYRYYTGDYFCLYLRGENMVCGMMPQLIVAIDYGDPYNCYDDEIWAYTFYEWPVNWSGLSSQGVKNVATAFLNDTAGEPISFTVDTQSALNQTPYIGGGAYGAFFEILSARIELATESKDINSDGSVDILDVISILRAAIGLE